MGATPSLPARITEPDDDLRNELIFPGMVNDQAALVADDVPRNYPHDIRDESLVSGNEGPEVPDTLMRTRKPRRGLSRQDLRDQLAEEKARTAELEECLRSTREQLEHKHQVIRNFTNDTNHALNVQAAVYEDKVDKLEAKLENFEAKNERLEFNVQAIVKESMLNHKEIHRMEKRKLRSDIDFVLNKWYELNEVKEDQDEKIEELHDEIDDLKRDRDIKVEKHTVEVNELGERVHDLETGLSELKERLRQPVDSVPKEIFDQSHRDHQVEIAELNQKRREEIAALKRSHRDELRGIHSAFQEAEDRNRTVSSCLKQERHCHQVEMNDQTRQIEELRSRCNRNGDHSASSSGESPCCEGGA